MTKSFINIEPDFYSVETFQKIMNLEESRGRLKEFCYSQDVKALSLEIRNLRREMKKKNKKELEDFKLQLEEFIEEYENKKRLEIAEIYNLVANGKYHVNIKVVEAKGKVAYKVVDMESMLICKLIALEIKKLYKQKSVNRDGVVEQLRVMLDDSMPKILIRADIYHFYESIPQKILLERIEKDACLTATSVKYLRKFFYEYNKLSNNLVYKGIPRGLSFSPALAEIYLCEFDRKIKEIKGVYFYKRYVDDIVLLANPNITNVDDCWNAIRKIAEGLSLALHEDNGKIVRKQLSTDDKIPFAFNYLGYQLKYDCGRTDILLTEEKVKRYCDTIDSVFSAYAKVANYRTKNEHGKKHSDGLLQLIHRLDALTGNGKLDGRRNFVKTGLFYSNRLLTDMSQLEKLDQYLAEVLNNPIKFEPPQNLFNYGDGNNHDENVMRIKKKILEKYCFKTGFNDRRMYRWKDYVLVIKQLQNLYYKYQL